MEKVLRNHLTFGSLMLGGLFLLLWLDSEIQRRTRGEFGLPHGLQGIGLLIMLILVLPTATRKLAVLFTAENVQPYKLISAFGYRRPGLARVSHSI